MQGSFDKQNQLYGPARWDWSVGILATCGLLLLAALVSHSSTVSHWVSEAAQAEFADTMTPDAAPVQTAQPAKSIQTVKAY
jgi:hypothetical protein